jgi:hypothetical protein
MSELRYEVGRRRVSPSDRGGRFVVVADVTKGFSAEICQRGKDAPGDDLPLDLGEPDLDLKASQANLERLHERPFSGASYHSVFHV